jgi:hypothetical protein
MSWCVTFGFRRVPLVARRSASRWHALQLGPTWKVCNRPEADISKTVLFKIQRLAATES